MDQETQARTATGEERVTLPRSMEMDTIFPAHEMLLAALARKPAEIRVDMGEIALVDASAVQLMLSFLRTTKQAGIRVHWENLSVQLYQEAATLGVEGELDY